MNRVFSILLFLIFLSLSQSSFSACDFEFVISKGNPDSWLYSKSKVYSGIVSEIKKRENYNSYRLVFNQNIAGGNVAARNNVLEIELNPNLKASMKISILAFEMANAYYNPEHQKIDQLVMNGHITSAEQFGLAHEIYEYEAIRLHRKILIDLADECTFLPKEFYYLVTPEPINIKNYRIPDLDTYLQTQKNSGHTAHYYAWFGKLKQQ